MSWGSSGDRWRWLFNSVGHAGVTGLNIYSMSSLLLARWLCWSYITLCFAGAPDHRICPCGSFVDGESARPRAQTGHNVP